MMANKDINHTTQGHCLCGAVRFTATLPEAHFRICHCGMCRRWSGSPLFGVGVETDSVSFFQGEEAITRYRSSDWAERGFCRHCGSHLFYHFKATDHYIMLLGLLDDQASFTLTGEIYTDDKPSCYDFAGDHSRMTGEQFVASLSTEAYPCRDLKED